MRWRPLRTRHGSCGRRRRTKPHERRCVFAHLSLTCSLQELEKRLAVGASEAESLRGQLNAAHERASGLQQQVVLSEQRQATVEVRARIGRGLQLPQAERADASAMRDQLTTLQTALAEVRRQLAERTDRCSLLEVRPSPRSAEHTRRRNSRRNAKRRCCVKQISTQRDVNLQSTALPPQERALPALQSSRCKTEWARPYHRAGVARAERECAAGR
jgi:hypothetical protein